MAHEHLKLIFLREILHCNDCSSLTMRNLEEISILNIFAHAARGKKF